MLDAPFDILRKDSAFFGFETNDRLTEHVFGCCAGNQVVGKILESYRKNGLENDRPRTLSNRIRTVVIGMAGAQMCSQNKRYEAYGFCLYAANVFVDHRSFLPEVCLTHYLPEAFEGQECELLPTDLLQAQVDAFSRKMVKELNVEGLKKDCSKLRRHIRALNDNREWLQNKLDYATAERTRLQNRVESLEKNCQSLAAELTAYKQSFLVRIAWKISRICKRIRKQ